MLLPRSLPTSPFDLIRTSLGNFSNRLQAREILSGPLSRHLHRPANHRAVKYPLARTPNNQVWATSCEKFRVLKKRSSLCLDASMKKATYAKCSRKKSTLFKIRKKNQNLNSWCSLIADTESSKIEYLTKNIYLKTSFWAIRELSNFALFLSTKICKTAKNLKYKNFVTVQRSWENSSKSLNFFIMFRNPIYQ